MLKLITELVEDESGATAIEYGLIVALISIALIAAMLALGISLTETFTTIADTLSAAA